MDTYVSYINDRGILTTEAFTKGNAEEFVKYSDDIGTYAVSSLDGQERLLHSVNDLACLIEGPNNRRHWMWQGKLHRLSAPAFICDGNEEYYVFGHYFSRDLLIKHGDFLRDLEGFALANGIDLHTMGQTDCKYGLLFGGVGDVILSATTGRFRIQEIATGHEIELDLAEIANAVNTVAAEEVRITAPTEDRIPSILAAAAMATAAIYAISQVKSKSLSKKEVSSEVQSAV